MDHVFPIIFFQYGNNNYDKTKSSFIPETTALPSGCDKNNLPCTSVGEVRIALPAILCAQFISFQLTRMP